MYFFISFICLVLVHVCLVQDQYQTWCIILQSKARIEPFKSHDQFVGVTSGKGENTKSIKGEEKTSLSREYLRKARSVWEAIFLNIMGRRIFFVQLLQCKINLQKGIKSISAFSFTLILVSKQQSVYQQWSDKVFTGLW